MEKFIAGLVLGMAGGALVIANSCKLRKLVKKNQDDFMCKCEKYIDEKLDQLVMPQSYLRVICTLLITMG